MPIYIPKKATFSPPSNFEMDPENDKDYLLDPDQLKDQLPQPYRRINKIIIDLLDSVWDIVSKRELNAKKAAAIIPPPSLDHCKILQGVDSVTAMVTLDGGTLLALGRPEGLVIMDTTSQEVQAQWQDPYAEIVCLHSTTVSKDIHLILTIDTLGTSRVFVYAASQLYCIQTVNENDPQAEVKILCQKYEFSPGGEFIGFVFENSGSHEVHVELYKSPIESWLKEYEEKTLKKPESEVHVEPEKSPTDKLISHSQQVMHSEEISVADVVVSRQRSNSLKSSQEKLPPVHLEFHPPELVTRIKPPPPLPPASNVLAPAISTGKGSDSADILGLGISHIINTAHLSRRETMFKHRNENIIKYLPQEKQEISSVPFLHFLPANRLFPNNLGSSSEENAPAILALWWTGHPHISFYSLSKTTKETEWKPDLVWPHASHITCLAVSQCGTHLAVGLEGGSTVIWDWKMGLSKSVLRGPEKNSVKSLRFLNPGLYPLDQPVYPPYSTDSATYVMAEYSNGSQVLLDTWSGSYQIPRSLSSEPENDDKVQTVLHLIPQAPRLMFVVEKSGKMFFKDLTTGSFVGQVVLPSPYTLQSPWEPMFAFGENGQTLFAKAEGVIVDDDGLPSRSSCVFEFPLHSLPEMSDFFDKSWLPSVIPLTVFNTLEHRIAALQNQRDQLMADRRERWLTQWMDLPSELIRVQQGALLRCNSQLLSMQKSQIVELVQQELVETVTDQDIC